MRSLVLLAFGLQAAETGYIDPTACRPCHTAIFDSYQRSGMGRSFSKVTSVPPLKEFRHQASERTYSIVKRGAESLLRREPLAIQKRIDYVVGSGNHSKTFVHRDEAGRLLELPLSWYAEGSEWNMSPGYDRPDHSDFRRELTDSCLFCHNGYPSNANGGLAQGIDCQRCHGPGEAHAKQKGAIVNPAKLSYERQLEVCLQCHLESASRTLPDSVRRPGRTSFSYRPGEPLGDFITYYEFEKSTAEDRITVNGAGYGMMKSACFLQSKGRLQCVTCHDPHRPVAPASHFTEVCRSCHAQAHETSTNDCARCHMQKRRTEDAVHVVMTDHRIRRRPLSGDLLTKVPERHDSASGPVKLLYPPRLPDNAETRLAHAMAQRDSTLLAPAIAEAKSMQSEPYFALGESLKREGRIVDAIRAYRAAVDRAPDDPAAYVPMAELMVGSGDARSAITSLEPAHKRMPRDVKLLNSLAIAYVQENRVDEAFQLLSSAVKIQPDDPVSWLNFGVCQEAKGDPQGALAAYQRSISLQPDLARARQFLQRLTQRSIR
ncbi:MAG TPA: tetratricopeptide repeat protein [Bryobacteraceae bacterium]|nr:tetratricopeptide repeat protein [Bryobacteraceae bacterium]